MNAIPLELQKMIVQRCTEKTRKSLKATSFGNKHLVEGTRLKSIGYLCISEAQDGKFEIGVGSSSSAFRRSLTSQSYENPQDFQKIILKTCDIQLDKLKNGYRELMQVEHLEIDAINENQAKNILSQIEPTYLTKIVFAEIVLVGESIREDQLLKLNAQLIITNFNHQISFRALVEKCLSTAHTKMRGFSFFGSNVFSELKQLYSPTSNKILLPTSHPQLKFELEFDEYKMFGTNYTVDGAIRFESERSATKFLYRDQSELRCFENVFIKLDFNTNFWEIAVQREHQHGYTYRAESVGEFHKHLEEILENTDCITYLKLELFNRAPTDNIDKTTNNNKIQWTPRRNKLMVRTLSVHGSHSITSIHDLLNQIDPVCVKQIEIESDETDSTLFDIPHLNDTSFVLITGSILRPEQLLRMTMPTFRSIEEKGSEKLQNQLLTSAAINQFLKNWLLHLNEGTYRCFQLTYLSPTINVEEILNGFKIIESRTNQNMRESVIESVYSEFVLKVEYSEDGFSGVRMPKSPPYFF